MKKKLFVFLLSLSICGPAFATLCYVELEPANWSYDNDVFSFEQGIEIQYAQGCEYLLGYLLGYTVNLPSLALVGDTVYAQADLELFDDNGSKLFTGSVDSGIYFHGLRTGIIFYNIDTTEFGNTYMVNDIELVLYSTGSKANTFEGNMTVTYIPEPSTLLLLCLGAVMVRRKRG